MRFCVSMHFEYAFWAYPLWQLHVADVPAFCSTGTVEHKVTHGAAAVSNVSET